jgi:hypothetical protein
MNNVYKCECRGHYLEHEYEEETKVHYLTFWTHGTEGEKPSLLRRAQEAWRVLTGKRLRGFWGVILNKEEAFKLSDDILSSQEGSKFF